MSMTIPHRYATFTLSNSENQALGSALRKLHYPAGDNYDGFVTAAREQVTASLPPSLRRFLETQRDTPTPAAAVVLRTAHRFY